MKRKYFILVIFLIITDYVLTQNYVFINVDSMIFDLKTNLTKSKYYSDSYLQDLIRMDYTLKSFVYEIKPDFLKEFEFLSKTQG